MKKLVPLLILLVVSGCAARPGVPPYLLSDPDYLYTKARESLGEGKADRAIELAGIVIDEHPKSDVYFDCVLILARAYEMKGGTGEAVRYATLVLEESERSDLRGEGAFLLGSIFYREGSYEQALRLNLDAYPLVVGVETKAEIRDQVKVLCERKLSLSQLELAAYENGDHPLAGYMFSVLALRASYRGENALAVRAAERVIVDFPNSSYAGEMRGLLADQDEEPAEDVALSTGRAVIGVLCPLSGRHESFGIRMRRAAELALRSADVPGNMVSLKLVDTESDPVVSIKSALELSSDASTAALVGGTSRSEVYALAGIGQCGGVPFISPVYSEPGLSTLGEYVFLVEPDPETQGSLIAAYALSELGIRNFTILSPATVEGRLSRDGFVHEVERGGGQVISAQEYQEGKTDFGQELKALVTSLDLFTSSLQESTVTGIFIPAAAEDAFLIAPQVRFHGIGSIMLVTSQWLSEGIAESGGEYIDGAFAVSSPRLGDFYSGRYSRFETDYLTVYGEPPDRLASDTFVAVSDIFRAIAKRGTSRSAVRDGMKEIRANAIARPGHSIVGIMDGRIVPPDILRAAIVPADTTGTLDYE